MNRFHYWLCGSRPWRAWIAGDLLPWALRGIPAGGDVLEIGPGPGAATGLLLATARHLTCVEIDRTLATRLAVRFQEPNITVRCEDATCLSARDGSFDAVICLMMLHHVVPRARQDLLLAEVSRVLRPGGAFVMLDGTAGRIMDLLHRGDTFLPVDPATVAARLERAGFEQISVEVRPHAFRAQARRPAAPRLAH